MLAAYSAASSSGGDTDVILVEKNEKLGKKLYLTGKGRCNLTNAADMEEFFSNIPTNPSFLISAFNAFSNEDLMELIKSTGTELKTERGQRVFPKSDKSSDIIKALSVLLGRAHVKVALKTYVKDILIENGKAAGIRTDRGVLRSDALILATGGFSYPSTGSSGEGHVFAAAAGHHPTAVYPSLIPLTSDDIPEIKRLRGLTLKNVTLSLFEDGIKKFSELGEMEFLPYGFGGALVLSASAHINDRSFKATELVIDMKPGLTEEQLEARLLRDFDASKNLPLKTVLQKLLPRQMIDPVIRRASVSSDKAVNSVTKEERKSLISVIKHVGFRVSGTRPIDEAVITRGGIPVKEIDPKTMGSRCAEGLYLAGEMIDVDAYTGGFNLQIAFSTGCLAGRSAAEHVTGGGGSDRKI